MTASQTIPVLDLQDFIGDPKNASGKGSQKSQKSSLRSDVFVQAFGQALSELGFFALVNHGVEERVIDAAYGAAEAFFALPEETKTHYDLAEYKGQRGFTCFGKEHAKNSSAPDLKEFWHVGRFENVWPREVPQFEPVMSTLFQQLETCAGHLMEACAQYLQQPSSFFSPQVAEGSTILRVIHYPPISPHATPASQRSAPHEDINLITLLCEATTPGLELLKPDGEWLPIHTGPGQIIVDTGDMLQSLSNGLLRSTTHRVINPNNNRDRRFSMPFFVHPRPEFDLTPLPNCVGRTTGTARFPSQTAAQYLHQRLKEIGLA